MKPFLLLISIWCCAFHAYSQDRFFPSTDGEKRNYVTTVEYQKVSISGICIIKCAEGRLFGSLINEFGIRMFDFIYDSHTGTVKCCNVIKMMDKWYIRKVLKRDMAFMLSNAGTRPDERTDGHFRLTLDEKTCILENTKNHIIYTFSHIPDLSGHETFE